jgi:hypothetical protein
MKRALFAIGSAGVVATAVGAEAAKVVVKGCTRRSAAHLLPNRHRNSLWNNGMIFLYGTKGMVVQKIS